MAKIEASRFMVASLQHVGDGGMRLAIPPCGVCGPAAWSKADHQYDLRAIELAGEPIAAAIGGYRCRIRHRARAADDT
jgi:hypothetical protein